MKKLYNIFIIAICCLTITACDNYDYTEKVSSVKVTSAETAIPAAGGTEGIGVKSPNTISAYAKDKWLSVSCSGDSVKVSANENMTRISRHTTVIIKSETDSTIVNVSQYGTMFSIDKSGTVYSHDIGETRTYKMKCNVPITFSSNKNWISGKYANDSLYVTAAPNPNGKPRDGYLKYAYGDIKDSIKVFQADAKDFSGSWYLECLKGTSNDTPITLKDTIFNVDVSPNATGDTLNIAMYDGMFTMHAAFNEGNLVLYAGDYMGPYDSNYAFLCLIDYDQGYLTWGTTRKFAAAYNKNSVYTYFEFKDNGSWSGYTVTGIDVSTFDTKNSSSMTSYDLVDEGLLYLIEPIMYRKN